ncbi:transglycosylase domain-containing protein [Candidatus Woesebacteria bacterium]|nr:transglycosylase domain-containing protein [Candidatus Woesebacteria bacterium]
MRDKLARFLAVLDQRAKILIARSEQFLNTYPRVKKVIEPAMVFKQKLQKKARSRLPGNALTEAQRRLRMIKLVRFGALAVLGSVVAGVIGFFVLFAWFSRELPKPGEVVRRTGFSTKIYDRNGKLLNDLYGDERRNPITIDQVPQHLKDAVVAIEDKEFYNHQGFDYLTVLRIPYNMVFRQRVVGGSTLTQQLVKNALLTNERSVTRKFKEFVLALQIERTFTKDQILEMYLNEAPYGGTAWGLGTAVEIYFNKPINELTVAESAILAGLPQRPSAYSPYTGGTDDDGTPLWKVRAKGVLIRMREDGYLTELSYDQALSELDTVQFQRAANDMKAPHFVFYVRDKLAEMYGDEVIESGGFSVTTSLDLEIQQKAQEVVTEELAKVERLNITNGAALVVDPRSGEILSMVGSRDFADASRSGQFNVAVDGLRQPGSSIKPVTYLALLRMGYTPSSMLMDVETTFATGHDVDKPYEPKNYDGKFRGPVSVRNALGSSLNIPAVKALALVGVDQFLQQAYELGFVTLEPTQENMRRFGLAVTLGGAEVHMLDTVTAYSSFANGGYKVEPVSILKVQDKDGKTIFEHRPVQGSQVITESEAFLINHILSDNNARLMAFGANSLLNMGAGVAVKTGTTNDQRDNWAIGWGSEVLVSAWVGNNDNSPMKQVASGVSGATPIWRRIMQAAQAAGYETPAWEQPEEVESIALDAISGYPQHDDFPAQESVAIRGTVPALPDPIHVKLKLCKGENKLANDARVAGGDYEEKEFLILREDDPVSQDGKNRWQEAIEAWINGQPDNGKYRPPSEYCGDQKEVFVRLEKPGNESNHSGTDIEVKVVADASDGIEKIELYVNGSLRETINNREYTGKLNLPAGKYELKAKAFSRSGQTKESGSVRIGTGGIGWNEEPKPTPSPSPTPEPSPTPSPSPTSSPVIDLP